MSPLLALLLAALVAGLAWRTRALTIAGTGAAVLVGTLVLAGTGWPGGAALLAFFVGSTLVSRLGDARTPAAIDAKGNRRDAAQVLANGGMAALGGLLALVVDPVAGFWVTVSALAAAGADTWATSLGTLSRTAPLHLTRLERVPTGTSGAVSWAGTLGGLVGSGVVAAAGAAGWMGWPAHPTAIAPAAWAAVTVVGVAGMLLDSLLGATVQARYRCPACDQASERPRHRCGTPTIPMGGWRWLDNDMVNALTTVLAALAGALLLPRVGT